MMNRSTTAASAIMAKAATVPVFVVALLLFCTKTQVFAQRPTAKNMKPVDTANKKGSKDTAVRSTFLGFISSNYPSTKTGVSADELSAYQQIVNKYKAGVSSHFKFLLKISAADRGELESIFKRMSRAQQLQQNLGFTYPGPPLPPQPPTQSNLNMWKNPRLFGIWINGKKVNNNELDDYKPSDFGIFYSSRLMKTAINYKKYKYQVDLYTADNYAKIYQQAIADQYKSQMFFKMPKSGSKNI